MRFYDIFNGDADGICALQQLRLAEPRDAELVTGTKRENRLVARVRPQAGDRLTILDIGLDLNREGLMRALEAGAACRYFDHHFPGAIPVHPLLEAHIDTSASLCTSLIVDGHLGGSARGWAVVAAFGDNLAASAQAAARPLRLADADVARLRALGECLNYNAYGESIEDLHFHPAELYRRLHPYADPLEFCARADEFGLLQEARAADLQRARQAAVQPVGDNSDAVFLPQEKWSRRVSGELANELARREPGRAHAILVRQGSGYVVSLRVPAEARRGAHEVAGLFPGGGGRRQAAGIQLLPEDKVGELLDALRAAYDQA